MSRSGRIRLIDDGRPLAHLAVADAQHEAAVVTNAHGVGPANLEADGLLSELGSACLLTLTGPGGVGKTRLAIRIAADTRGHYPDGVWLVELAPLTEPGLVAQTVATACGIAEARGVTILDALAARLAAARALLILDNCEHLVEACAQTAAALLRSCPRLTILATSREALRVTGETARRIVPLSLPKPGRVTASTAVRSEAVRLFAERARLAWSDFEITDRNAPAVAEICRRLDGLPLALELAAARCNMLPPEQMLSQLGGELWTINASTRDAPARRRTLRAAIGWSYDLLDEPEQRLLASASVFAGGWSLEACAAVCSDTPGGMLGPTVEILSSLVGKSLVSADVFGDAARFRMLEVVRAFAAERLLERGDAPAIRERHARYFRGLGEEAEPWLSGTRAAEWLDRVETEHDNMRAALRFLLDEGSEGALRLAAAIRMFWAVRGHLTEGRDWLEAALASAVEAPAALQARARFGAGNIAMWQGNLGRARAHFEEGGASAKRAADPLLTATLIYSLGIVVELEGDLATARDLFRKSLAAGRALEHTVLVANSLNALGEVARQERDWRSARDFYEQSLDVSRRSENQRSVRMALGNIAAVAVEEGDLSAAASCYREALEIDRSLGSQPSISHSLDGLAAVAAEGGALRRAGRLAGAAQAVRDAIGYELEPVDRTFRDRCLARLRERLEPQALASVLAEGAALTIDEAIAEALAISDISE